MKRNIIFIIILLVLLSAIITAEKVYTNNFKKAINDVIERCSGARDEFISCAETIDKIMSKRKPYNKLFYSKDVTHRIINEVEKLKVYAVANELSDAQASVENIRFLLKSMLRFNEND